MLTTDKVIPVAIGLLWCGFTLVPYGHALRFRRSIEDYMRSGTTQLPTRSQELLDGLYRACRYTFEAWGILLTIPAGFAYGGLLNRPDSIDHLFAAMQYWGILGVGGLALALIYGFESDVLEHPSRIVFFTASVIILFVVTADVGAVCGTNKVFTSTVSTPLPISAIKDRITPYWGVIAVAFIPCMLCGFSERVGRRVDSWPKKIVRVASGHGRS